MRALRPNFAIRLLSGPGPTVLLICLLHFGLLHAAAQSTAVFPGQTAVGHPSAPLTVTVTVTTFGVAASPRVVTQSVANGDFAQAGGSCTAGTLYAPGQQCSVAVVFTPQGPGLRLGAVELLDGNGHLLGESNVTGVGQGPLAVLDPGNILTVAGDGDWIYKGDGVPATQAPIFLPTGVVVDAGGNLYLADSNNNRVRRVDAATGTITTVAGTGTAGYSGDGGAATAAMVSTPAGLALDGAGNLYFADTGNQVVRRVDAVTGVITHGGRHSRRGRIRRRRRRGHAGAALGPRSDRL